MIYNLLFTSAAFVNLVTYLSFEIRRRAYYILLFLLFLFVTFRWQVGCDWGGYLVHAQRGGMPFDDALALPEPGYWLLVVTLNRLGFEYPAINVIAALSFFSGVHAVARRQPDPLVYLTLLFPLLITGVAMSATRQGLAMGFLCYAFNAFIDKRPARYILLIFLGMSFHKSLIAFIVLVPFLFEIGARNKFIAICAALPVVLYLATTDTADRYTSMYVGTRYEAAGGIFRTFVVAATGIAFHFLKARWKTYSPKDFELLNLVYPAMIAVLPLTFVSSVIGDRFGYYLMLLAYVIQAKAYLLVDRRNAFFFFLIPVMVGGLVLFGWSQFSSLFSLCYLPYRTWWIMD